MSYNKYGNKKTEIDGYKFDSLREKNRYCELKLLVKAKKIYQLDLQPRFELQRGFEDGLGKKHRKIEYVADFAYLDANKGKFIVEDVKGMKTEVYKLKKKLFLYKFPNYIFCEI